MGSGSGSGSGPSGDLPGFWRCSTLGIGGSGGGRYREPWTRVMRAGYVEPWSEPVAAWVEAGAACIGIDLQAMADPGDVTILPGKISDLIWYVKKARGENLFCGVEHLGIYPESGQAASELTDWYNDLFGFDVDEGEGWYFVRSSGPGRIEILKHHELTKAHVAIKVRHFDLACRMLADKGVEFEPQGSFRDEDNKLLKPDVVIHLPDGKDVIIDSKVSLDAYEQYCSAEDENDQQEALKAHIEAVRNHITTLSEKDYTAVKGLRSLDFVLMFIPVEPAFAVNKKSSPIKISTSLFCILIPSSNNKEFFLFTEL